MTEPARRNLLAGLERRQPEQREPDDAAIVRVAERHGFARSEAAPPPAAAPAAPVPVDDGEHEVTLRRRRKLRNRTQQFNVRLRPDTVDVIYEEANGRDVPIAQVIEEMVEAFQALKGRATN